MREDAPLVELSTDKAVVEVPSPVSGVVVAVSGKPGDTLAVGSELAVFEVEGALEGQGVPSAAPSARPTAPALTAPPARSVPAAPPVAAASLAPATQDSLLPARVMASPATRRRAAETGLDLARVQGTGPGGRIVEADLERAQHGTPGITEIPVIGVRRVIAQRISDSKRNAPHFAYVEEVDVTGLEALRGGLRGDLEGGDEPPARREARW